MCDPALLDTLETLSHHSTFGLWGWGEQREQLKSVMLGLDKRREYTETEINTLLQVWLSQVGTHFHLDYVNLRRHLIDEEFLGRSKDGSRYWVATYSRNQMYFDPEINEIDIPDLIKSNRELSTKRKAVFEQTSIGS